MATEDRGPELLAIIWVFTALAIITVTLKVITRAHILRGLTWDDFFILISLVLIVICTSIFTYDVAIGMGKHAIDIPTERLSLVMKVNFIGNPFGIMAYSFPNISVAILVNHVLPPNRLRAGALYLLAISQCVIAGISCVLLFTQCTPTESLWNPTVPHTCLAAGTVSRYSYFVGAYTALTDIILGVVPSLAFWGLKLPTKTKVGLCFLMLCTLFAAICAIVKTTKLNELDDLTDFTYGSVDLIIWAIVEANVIIIAACMPTLRPFFHHAFKREPASEGRGLFRSLFSGRLSSKKSLIRSSNNDQNSYYGQHEMSGNQNSIHVTKNSDAAPRRSNDSETAIWRTTDITHSVTHIDDGPRKGTTSTMV
ncbi:hypothetical protein PFICI_07770 [Pestalotiopsis fici W106-1]|uniref:Rhodopsin domain-containing protein n=1 Tax=Pestalotiopsis fici (strain W106-1 / CGMCC3.15140) TaxID=1229662 RepID=W3X506_PESFW|nr:uncharacterized protein PFICI_07770 [Pestalotiopsis fici W106-1]ETS80241.1 hypothetical protein PFICI_07770 [Pestalotiopsis fici W106-1]